MPFPCLNYEQIAAPSLAIVQQEEFVFNLDKELNPHYKLFWGSSYDYCAFKSTTLELRYDFQFMPPSNHKVLFPEQSPHKNLVPFHIL